jgi:hypothetical protein
MNLYPTAVSRIRRRRTTAWLALWLVGSVAGGPAPSAAAAATNEVTAASIVHDLGYDKNDQGQVATLLAFVAREDRRPWYVDDALLVLYWPQGIWQLVHAVRNPKYPKDYKFTPGSTAWQLHHVYDAPSFAERSFDHPPTREEVNLFLKDNEFQFKSDRIFRVAERVFYDDAWEKVLGYRSEIKPIKRAVPASQADKNVGGTSGLSEEAVSSRMLGRWELPGGKEPMEFSKDGKCKVHFGDDMIDGSYTIASDGKIMVNARTKEITLSAPYHFEGDRLTDGVVFFEGGERYWIKLKK